MTKKEENLYDVRIAERNIRDGAITKKEFENHLKSLPDVEEKGEPLVIEEDLVDDEATIEETIEEETE